MTRVLFRFIVFAFFAVVPAAAQAQGIFNREVGPYYYGVATPVMEIVQDLSKKQGFKIEIRGLPPLQNTFHGEIRREKLRDVLNNTLLPLLQSSARMTDDTLTILGPGYRPSAAELVPPEEAPAEQSSFSYPSGAPWDVLTAGSYAAARRAIEERGRQRDFIASQRYYDKVAYYDAQRDYEPELRYGYGYGRYYGGSLRGEIISRQIQGAATHGYLKLYTMGDEDFSRHLVVLRLDNESKWRVVGAGGKSFRLFHEPMELPVGKQRLRFELRKGGVTRYYEEDFDIESKFDRNHALQYPISEDMMKSFAKTERIMRR